MQADAVAVPPSSLRPSPVSKDHFEHPQPQPQSRPGPASRRASSSSTRSASSGTVQRRRVASSRTPSENPSTPVRNGPRLPGSLPPRALAGPIAATPPRSATGSPPLSLEQLQRIKRELCSERGSSSDDRRSLNITSSSAEDDNDDDDEPAPAGAQVDPDATPLTLRLPWPRDPTEVGLARRTRKSASSFGSLRPRRIGRLTSREKLTRLSFGQDVSENDASPKSADPAPSTPVGSTVPFPSADSPPVRRSVQPSSPSSPATANRRRSRLPPRTSGKTLVSGASGVTLRRRHASSSSEYLESLKDPASWGRAKGRLLTQPHSRSLGAASGLALFARSGTAHPSPASALKAAVSGNPNAGTAAAAATSTEAPGPATLTSQDSTVKAFGPVKAKGSGRRYVSLPPGLFTSPPPASQTPSNPVTTDPLKDEARGPGAVQLPAPVGAASRIASPAIPNVPSPIPPPAEPAPEPAQPTSYPHPTPAETPQADMEHPNYRVDEYAPGQRERAVDQRELHQTMGPRKGQQVLKQGAYQAFSEEDEDESDEDGQTEDLDEEEELDDYGNPLPPHPRHHRPYPHGPRHHPHEGEDEEEFHEDDPDLQYDPQMDDEGHHHRPNIYQEADLDAEHGGVTPGLGPITGDEKGWDPMQQSHRNSRLQEPLIAPPQTRSPANNGNQNLGASTQGAAPTSTGGAASAGVGQSPDLYGQPEQWQGKGAQQRSRRPSIGRPGIRGAPLNPTIPQPLAPQPQQQQQQQPLPSRQQHLPPGASHRVQPGGVRVLPNPAAGGAAGDDNNEAVRRYLAGMSSEGALPPDMVDVRSRGPSPGPAPPPQQQQQPQYGGVQSTKAFHPLPPVPSQAPPQQAPYPPQPTATQGVQFPRQERQPVPASQGSPYPAGAGSGGRGEGQGSGSSPTVGGVTGSRAHATSNPPKTNASRAQGGLAGGPNTSSGPSAAESRAQRALSGPQTAASTKVSSPPGSNRARLGNSGPPGGAPMLPLAAAAGHGGTIGAGGGSRKRRVSDGSTSGALRKDMLLAKMAEALTTEKEKATLYQREFNEAEREIDELAIQIDEMKKQHAKTLSVLKKEIGALKKEREALVQALEEAEGVDDEEADRYLSLLDPAQAALLHGTSEVDDGEIEDEEEEEEAAEPLQHSPSKASKLDTAGTVRAQMQEKAAQRAQRINAAMVKLGSENASHSDLPGAPVATNANPSDEAVVAPRGGPRDRHSSAGPKGVMHRLSKTGRRPDSRQSRDGATVPGSTASDGRPGGFFRNRRSSSASRTRTQSQTQPVGHGPSHARHQSDSEALDRAMHANGNGNGASSGFFDSGSLYPRAGMDAGSRRGELETSDAKQKSKIGKMFRKVFPSYRDDSDFTESDDEPANKGYGLGGVRR